METKQIGTLVACLAIAMCAQAQSGTQSVQMYGLVDSGVEVNRSGLGTNHRLIAGGSLGSRLGFRGSEDLGGGYRAVFKLEQGILVNTGALGQGGRGFGREASVGIGSPYGTVLLGRLPTPYFTSQPWIDAFQLMGGSLIAVTRSGTASRQLLPLAADGRADNAVMYASPKFSGLELQLLRNKPEAGGVNGPTTGASLRYTASGADVLLGWTRQQGVGTDGDVAGLVFGGSLDLGAVQVYAGVDREKNACTTCTGAKTRIAGLTARGGGDFAIFNLGVRVPVGAVTYIAQIYRLRDRSDYAVDPGSRDVSWLGVGGEYRFTRRTLLYTSLSTIQNRNGSQYALGTGGDQRPAGSVGPGDPSSSTLAFGVRHSF
jgi:predicted porin